MSFPLKALRAATQSSVPVKLGAETGRGKKLELTRKTLLHKICTQNRCDYATLYKTEIPLETL